MASLEADGVVSMEEDVEKELLSRCGNCRLEFEDETSKITKINVRAVDHYQNALGNIVHDNERISVTAIQALSRIYGYPLNYTQDGPWSENDSCSLCHKCADSLTNFYRAFLELQKLTNEASYISRGLNKIHKCIQESFSSHEEVEKDNENTQNEVSTKFLQKRITKKSTSMSPRKIAQENKVVSKKDKKSDEDIPTQNVDSAACLVEVKLETFQDGSSEAFQGNTPTARQESKKNLDEIYNEPVRGTTEVISPSGQIIRQSTRTRKVRKLMDLGESVQRKPSVVGTVGKRNQRFLSKKRFGTRNDEICKATLPKNDDGKFSEDYNNQEKVTSQDGRFICPEPNCLKSFKGIKMLNKHVILHSKKVKLNSPSKVDQITLGACRNKGGNSASNTQELTFPTQEASTEPPEQLTKLLTSPKTNSTLIEKQYKCQHCDKRFLLKKMFEKHLSAHENQRAQCRCTICDKKFSTAFSLARHISSIHDVNESKVPNNDYTSRIDQSGKELEKKDGGNYDTFLKCNQCNKEFKKKSQFRMHMLFHNDKEPRFGCSKCPKTFFQPNGLRRHMLVHTMENPLVCKECDKVFERQDHYKRHVEIVHNQKKPKRKKVDPKNDPDHTCKECHKTFSRKEYLSLHMRIHTGEKPHMCSICGKQFRDPRNLAQHLVTHKTDRPFCCSVCGLTFKRAHHLNDHEGTHRQNVARPFVCTFPHCEKAFKLRKHLVSHELVHSGSKDHPCHVCGRAFSRKDNLRQHINKIHGKEFAEDMKVVLDQQREKYRQAQLQKEVGDAVVHENAEDSLELEEILGEVPISALATSETDILTGDDSQIAEVLSIIPSSDGTLTLTQSTSGTPTQYTYSTI